jgi:hypothetical protein
MSEVRNKISQALSGMKYVFPDLQCNGATKYPNPDSEELESFTDFITSVVNSFRREAFLAGYQAVVKDSPFHISPESSELEKVQNSHDAENAWQEFDK